ncbi:MAG TPA: TolC family protein [Polyangia bacterium]
MTLLLVVGCGGVEAARGHDQVAALVADRAGARTRWEAGPPPDAQIATWIRAQLAPGLTRQTAVEIALVNNPTLKETYEHLGASQADMVQAGLLRNPTLGIDLGFGNGPVSELRGSIVQDFLDLFVLRTRKDIAREQFVADTLRVADAALQVVADVSKAFFDVQAGMALVDQRGQSLETLAVAAALVERRHDAGNATDLEHAEETATLEEARLDLARDQLELVERRERLNRWLGLSGRRAPGPCAKGCPARRRSCPRRRGSTRRR